VLKVRRSTYILWIVPIVVALIRIVLVRGRTLAVVRSATWSLLLWWESVVRRIVFGGVIWRLLSIVRLTISMRRLTIHGLVRGIAVMLCVLRRWRELVGMREVLIRVVSGVRSVRIWAKCRAGTRLLFL